MKTLSKLILTAVVACLVFICTFVTANAQQRGNQRARVSPNASVSQTIGTTEVLITYGRPSVNGRDVFGGLEPLGEVWRTGANESTVIVFPKDVTIEGQPLEAGTYSIYTIPREDEWTIIFNSKLSWGTRYDKSKDVLRVQVESKEAPFREQFMIYFENVTDHAADIVLHWADTKVPFTVEV